MKRSKDLNQDRIYWKLWIYNKICFPINQFEFRLFNSYLVKDSSFSRHRRHYCSKWCPSWGWFRRHRIKGNRRFTFIYLLNQISDLLFSCDSWIFFRSHKKKGIYSSVLSSCWNAWWFCWVWIKSCCTSRVIVTPYISIIHNIINKCIGLLKND